MYLLFIVDCTIVMHDNKDIHFCICIHIILFKGVKEIPQIN